MSKNIKDIGKKLLGQSLNSFHGKTGLTQLEENNKMQDGILDGILSQVDDAYIEKTEQSNVIHLDGSGDGVVVLDSIEGNTMVNCINRIPFNTTPTTTPNTVYCNNDGYITVNAKEGTYTNAFISKDYCNLKPNTKYTLIIEVVENTLSGGFLVGEEYRSNICTRFDFILSAKQTGIFKIVSTTKDGEDFTNGQYALRSFALNTNNLDGEKIKYRIFMLEGDYSNVEVNYFEGLQSSFEEKANEQGKYEIEILSNNKNLFDIKRTVSGYINGADGRLMSSDCLNRVSDYIKVKPNTIYTYITTVKVTEYNNKKQSWNAMAFYDENKQFITRPTKLGTQNYLGEETIIFEYRTSANCKYIRVGSRYLEDSSAKVTFIEGSYKTHYPLEQNKIKLLLNEPLRAIDDTKDRLCIKDNILVVERNTLEVNLTSDKNYIHYSYQQVNLDPILPFSYSVNELLKNDIQKVICDKLPYDRSAIHHRNVVGIASFRNDSQGHNAIRFGIHKNTLGITGSLSNISYINELKTYLTDNPMKVIVQLEEPVYEEVLNEYGEPIILEGYENGTLYIDSTVIPTTTVRYTPKMESFKTLKEVNKNNNLTTLDINENIIPYMMDVDYMIMEKELCLLNTKNIRKMEVLDMTSMQKRTQDMLERLFRGKSLTEQEARERVIIYLEANKITAEQANYLNEVILEVYA